LAEYTPEVITNMISNIYLHVEETDVGSIRVNFIAISESPTV